MFRNSFQNILRWYRNYGNDLQKIIIGWFMYDRVFARRYFESVLSLIFFPAKFEMALFCHHFITL